MSYTPTVHRTTYPLLSSLRLPPSTIILITGAGSGIGRATALSHARAGASVLVLLGRRAEPLEQTAQLISESFPAVSVSVYAVDILSRGGVGEIFGKHRVDTVIHCAGTLLPLEPLGKQDGEEVWRSIEVNLRGAMNIALEFVKSLADEGEGRKGVMVALNSAGVFMPSFPGVGAYLAAKLASVKLLNAVEVESGGRLRVTHVHPGAVKTEMAAEFERVGLVFPYDDVALPADFLVWAGSAEADFLGGRFVFASWDVEELRKKRGEIEKGLDLTVGLTGLGA